MFVYIVCRVLHLKFDFIVAHGFNVGKLCVVLTK